MQKEFSDSPNLLNKYGEMEISGWGKELQADYSRTKTHLFGLLAKEWDTYYIDSGECGVIFTISNYGYQTQLIATIMVYKENLSHTVTITSPFPFNRIDMPQNSRSGDIIFSNSRAGVTFRTFSDKRFIKAEILNFKNGINLNAALTLEDSNRKNMTAFIPVDGSKKNFFYNQKISSMAISGEIRFGGQEYLFNEATSNAFLDWGRGIFQRKMLRNFCCAMGSIYYSPFVLSLGYGYADQSKTTENYFYYDNEYHKLGRALFEIPRNKKSPWYMVTEDNRVRVKFQPDIHSTSHRNLGIVSSHNLLVSGTYNGKVFLNNGYEIQIKDMRGFARSEHNIW